MKLFLEIETCIFCVTLPFGYPKGTLNSICQKTEVIILQSLLFALKKNIHLFFIFPYLLERHLEHSRM